MGSILKPGYVRWDGLKYVLDPGVEIVGPPGVPGPTGPAGSAGSAGSQGPPGNPTIIFRPGVSTAAPAYATWPEVITAVTAFNGSTPTPVTIFFDDTTSGCVIPAGSWNFGPLVTFDGTPNSGDGNSGVITIADGATFVHAPVRILNSVLRSNSSAPVITTVPADQRLELRNAFIECTGTAPMYNITQDLSIMLFDGAGVTLNTFAPVIQSTGQFFIYMFDGTSLLTNTLSTTSTIYMEVNSSSARPFPQTASATNVAFGLNKGNLDPFGFLSYGPTSNRPILTGLQPGYRFFDTTLDTLVVWDGNAWITLGGGAPTGPAGGDLAGTYPNPTVFQVSGDNLGSGNLNILSAKTTNIANAHYQPWSEQGEQLMSGTGIGLAITNVPNNTGIQFDVALQVVNNSTSDFASWKLSLAAYNNGSTTVTVGPVPSPSGVAPDRYTAGAGGWLATITLAGTTVSLQIVSVPSGSRAGFTYQVLPITQ